MFKKLIAVALLVLAGTTASFAVNPDSFDITCTLSLTYAVTITTPAAGIAFNTVDVNQTYVSATSATVTNSGSVSADWKISAAPNTGTTWTLGASPAANVASLYAVLNTTPALSGDYSTGSDYLSGTASNMDVGHFSVNQNGNGVAKTTSRNLWLRLDSPTDSDSSASQSFKVNVQAFPASTF